MQSRTQLIIQQLGIQQWLPRQQPSRAASIAILWRDQDFSRSVAQPRVIAHGMHAQSDQQIQQPSSIAHNVVNFTDDIAPQNLKPSHANADLVVSSPLPVLDEIKPLSYMQRLDYQLLVHEQFVILAAVQNSTEMQLLQNIASCCTATLQSLSWPLPISSWDMHDLLLESYLNGFFYAQQQKCCIVLGECDENIKQLHFAQRQHAAPLAQLLRSAEAKSALWNLLYPYIY